MGRMICVYVCVCRQKQDKRHAPRICCPHAQSRNAATTSVRSNNRMFGAVDAYALVVGNVDHLARNPYQSKIRSSHAFDFSPSIHPLTIHTPDRYIHPPVRRRPQRPPISARPLRPHLADARFTTLNQATHRLQCRS